MCTQLLPCVLDPVLGVLDVRVRPLVGEASPPFSLNRRLQLRCDVTSDPPMQLAHVTWFVGDDKRPLVIGKKYAVWIEPPGGMSLWATSVLTIYGVQGADLGTYVCQATNSAGMTSRSSLLIQQCKYSLCYQSRVVDFPQQSAHPAM